LKLSLRTNGTEHGKKRKKKKKKGELGLKTNESKPWGRARCDEPIAQINIGFGIKPYIVGNAVLGNESKQKSEQLATRRIELTPRSADKYYKKK
jgi:hypothetical protein